MPEEAAFDQTQLMVKAPACSYFNMPTPHKVCLVWFHFRLTAGQPLTGYRIAFLWYPARLKLEAG